MIKIKIMDFVGLILGLSIASVYLNDSYRDITWLISGIAVFLFFVLYFRLKK